MIVLSGSNLAYNYLPAMHSKLNSDMYPLIMR